MLRIILFSTLLVSATLPASTIYQIDDGTSEFGVRPALGTGSSLIWLNSYQAAIGGNVIRRVSAGANVNMNAAQAGDGMSLFLWTDPTNDGNPVDAVLAASAVVVLNTTGIYTATLNTPVTIAEGAWFFVGAGYVSPREGAIFVAQGDGSNVLVNRSYRVSWQAPDPMSPGNIGGPASSFVLASNHLDNFGPWLIRAEGDAIPEPATWVVALGGLTALWIRNRR